MHVNWLRICADGGELAAKLTDHFEKLYMLDVDARRTAEGRRISEITAWKEADRMATAGETEMDEQYSRNLCFVQVSILALDIIIQV